jgi:hypothetical protein
VPSIPDSLPLESIDVSKGIKAEDQAKAAERKGNYEKAHDLYSAASDHYYNAANLTQNDDLRKQYTQKGGDMAVKSITMSIKANGAMIDSWHPTK